MRVAAIFTQKKKRKGKKNLTSRQLRMRNKNVGTDPCDVMGFCRIGKVSKMYLVVKHGTVVAIEP